MSTTWVHTRAFFSLETTFEIGKSKLSAPKRLSECFKHKIALVINNMTIIESMLSDQNIDYLDG